MYSVYRDIHRRAAAWRDPLTLVRTEFPFFCHFLYTRMFELSANYDAKKYI